MTRLALHGLGESLREVSQLFAKNGLCFSEVLGAYVDLDGSVAAIASPQDVDMSCASCGYNGEVNASRREGFE
jgi:hypothetical protein